jgi:hypothetical protein
MVREVSNSDDVIDSRDVIARIEELSELREAASEAREAWEAATDDNRDELEDELTQADANFDEDTQAELAALESLAEEAEGYADDWKYGAALIRESYWVEYVQELLEDIGDLPKDLPHYIEIDWEKTARNIQVDYTSVDFDGVTYWVR